MKNKMHKWMIVIGVLVVLIFMSSEVLGDTCVQNKNWYKDNMWFCFADTKYPQGIPCSSNSDCKSNYEINVQNAENTGCCWKNQICTGIANVYFKGGISNSGGNYEFTCQPPTCYKNSHCGSYLCLYGSNGGKCSEKYTSINNPNYYTTLQDGCPNGKYLYKPDSGYYKCVDCLLDTQCLYGGTCNDNKCVGVGECVDSSDCVINLHESDVVEPNNCVNNHCVKHGCNIDSDCDRFSSEVGNVCDTSQHKCVKCLEDDDCENPSFECSNNNCLPKDCNDDPCCQANGYAVFDSIFEQCADCDSSNYNDGTPCVAGSEVECTQQEKSKCNGETPYCSSGYKCVECLKDNQCVVSDKKNAVCVLGSCKYSCSDNADCNWPYATCNSGSCVTTNCGLFACAAPGEQNLFGMNWDLGMYCHLDTLTCKLGNPKTTNKNNGPYNGPSSKTTKPDKDDAEFIVLNLMPGTFYQIQTKKMQDLGCAKKNTKTPGQCIDITDDACVKGAGDCAQPYKGVCPGQDLFCCANKISEEETHDKKKCEPKPASTGGGGSGGGLSSGACPILSGPSNVLSAINPYQKQAANTGVAPAILSHHVTLLETTSNLQFTDGNCKQYGGDYACGTLYSFNNPSSSQAKQYGKIGFCRQPSCKLIELGSGYGSMINCLQNLKFGNSDSNCIAKASGVQEENNGVWMNFKCESNDCSEESCSEAFSAMYSGLPAKQFQHTGTFNYKAFVSFDSLFGTKLTDGGYCQTDSGCDCTNIKKTKTVKIKFGSTCFEHCGDLEYIPDNPCTCSTGTMGYFANSPLVCCAGSAFSKKFVMDKEQTTPITTCGKCVNIKSCNDYDDQSCDADPCKISFQKGTICELTASGGYYSCKAKKSSSSTSNANSGKGTIKIKFKNLGSVDANEVIDGFSVDIYECESSVDCSPSNKKIASLSGGATNKPLSTTVTLPELGNVKFFVQGKKSGIQWVAKTASTSFNKEKGKTKDTVTLTFKKEGTGFLGKLLGGK